MTVLFVTGTDTGVGKTIATAALACHARRAGLAVALCKPVQTGTRSGDDDLAEAVRLSGVTQFAGLARYPLALAPAAAAEQAGMALPTREELLRLVRGLDGPGRLVLVEGAGGLLVQLAAQGVTLRDLAVDLGAPVLVVVGAGLGTLNHTALTLEALAAREIHCAGLVIGSWPTSPGPAETSNRAVLGEMAAVRAVLPAGAGSLDAAAFTAVSAAAFDPHWVSALVR